MQVTVEQLNELARKMTVSVPAEELETEISKRLRQLQKTVRLPGFRPGKVPAKVIESKYAAGMVNEVAGDLINRYYFNALRQENIEPASQPKIETITLERGKNLDFNAEFEVYPSVKSTDISGATIEKPVCDISDADIDLTIDRIRQQRVEWVETAKAAENGDQVKIDFHGKIDNESFDGGKAENYEVVIGENSLLKDFEEGLVGMTAAQEKTISVPFPDDYPVKNLAGKTATFDITLHQVNVANLPTLDEEFIKTLGVNTGSVEEFKQQVRDNMGRELETRVESNIREQVMQAVIDANPMSLPQGLVDQEKELLINQRNQRLQQQGVDPAQVPVNDEAIDKQAAQRVTLSIAIKEVIKKYEISLDQAKVTEKLEKMAKVYEKPEEFLSWYKQDANRLSQLEATVMEDQVIDALLNTAAVVDKNVAFSEFVSG